MTMRPSEFECIPAIVLAGGLGLRIRPEFAEGPKCLAPVVGEPFLRYVIESLRSEGVREVVLATGHQGQQIHSWLSANRWPGLNIRCVQEARPLGTAGALRHAALSHISARYFVINGDSILKVSLREFLDFHVAKAAVVSLALARVDDTGRYGTVELGGDDKILAFLEKSLGSSISGGLINGGVYLFDHDIVQRIPPNRPCSLEHDIFPQLLARPFFGFSRTGYFLDIGIPADYRKAQVEIPRWIQLKKN
jgi:NDP-sugar pyrophosphorylase family protein